MFAIPSLQCEGGNCAGVDTEDAVFVTVLVDKDDGLWYDGSTAKKCHNEHLYSS